MGIGDILNLTPAQKLGAGIIRVVNERVGFAPYFGAALRGLLRRQMTPEQEAALTEMHGRATMAVTKDGILYWSPTYVAALSVDELAFRLMHEVMHVLLKHFDRANVIGVTPDTQQAMNLACFPAGTFVGDRRIETMRKGDAILSAEGTWGTVQATMRRRFRGRLVVLRASGGLPVEATPEHPFLVSKRKYKTSYPIRLLPPAWVQAKDIQQGDYVYLPSPSALPQPATLPVAAFAEAGGRKRMVLKSGFPLTPDTAWLLGLWTAEGSSGQSTILSLGAHETAPADRAVSIAKTLGFSAMVGAPNDRNGCTVYLGGPILGRAFRAWCGRGSHNKRVPHFILTHPDEAIRAAYLQGVHDGDGAEFKQFQCVGVASAELVHGLRLLRMSLGGFAWLDIAKQQEGRLINGKALPAGVLYRAKWSTKPLVPTTRKLNGSVVPSHSRRWRATEHGLAVPVVSVARRTFSGLVYNFTTTTHTYTAGGLAVHNCDMSINEGLRENWPKLGADGAYPENYGQPPKLASEERYRLLKKNAGNGGKGKVGVGSGHCGSCAGNPIPGEDPGQGRSEAQLARMRKEVAEAVKAHVAQKGIGSVPSDLDVWAGAELTPPKIDWRERIGQLVRAAVAYRPGSVDFDWSKMSRRQGGLGYGVGRPIVPSMRAPVPRIACVVDTSGSMGGGLLVEAASELQGVFNAVGAAVTVCTVDAAVHGLQECASIQDALQLMQGGGGTDMRPGIEAFVERQPRSELLIVLTDGEIPDPGEEPPFRVIWCIVGGSSFSPAWGEVVRVDEDGETP